MTEPLFDPPPGSVRAAAPADPYAGLSRDARRTRRQADAAAAGRHPLSLALNSPLPLHPDAAPGDDRDADGLRCGTCEFRELFAHNSRNYPKCTFGNGARITRGAGTDVRAHWPACLNYQPADGDR